MSGKSGGNRLLFSLKASILLTAAVFIIPLALYGDHENNANFENSENPFEMRRKTISVLTNRHSSIYVSDNVKLQIEQKAADIEKTGIKHKDACHVASAIIAGADYFLSTDYRLLKYKTDEIKMMNPTEFVKELEVENDG